MSCKIMEIQPIMEKLSNSELSRLYGGAWSQCDILIIAANSAGSTWTDEEWDNWEKLYNETCAKTDFVYDPETGEWSQP